MNTDQIKEIVALVKEFELTELEVEEKNLKLRVSRQKNEVSSLPSPQIIHNIPANLTAETGAIQATPELAQGEVKAIEDRGLHVIKSPMVGTFYQSPSPESDFFVKIGDVVDVNSIVCIIEAMKVMNEIHAEVKGKIVEVLAAEGESVEFGQPLFKVKP